MSEIAHLESKTKRAAREERGHPKLLPGNYKSSVSDQRKVPRFGF